MCGFHRGGVYVLNPSQSTHSPLRPFSPTHTTTPPVQTPSTLSPRVSHLFTSCMYLFVPNHFTLLTAMLLMSLLFAKESFPPVLFASLSAQHSMKPWRRFSFSGRRGGSRSRSRGPVSSKKWTVDKKVERKRWEGKGRQHSSNADAMHARTAHSGWSDLEVTSQKSVVETHPYQKFSHPSIVP